MWNDIETDIDLLGHWRVAKTITALIRQESLSPLTVGVYGDWGAGKSSVLKLVEKELQTDERTRCLTFNAWLFQGFEDAKSVLMEAIITRLRADQKLGSKIEAKARELLNRIDWLKLGRTAAGLAITAFTGIPDPALLSGVLEKLKGLGADPGSISPEQLKEFAATVSRAWKEGQSNRIPDHILAFRADFEKLLRTAELDRLVVLIDDLDRCLPETAIAVLEAMRLFLYVPGTVFIIAADEKMIAYAVRKHFPDLPVGIGPSDYTRNYLEKLVQVPFRVPSLGPVETRTYITLLLADQALRGDEGSLEKLRNSAVEVISRPWEGKRLDESLVKSKLGTMPPKLKEPLLLASRISHVLATGLSGNPRQIKRFLNSLMVRVQIAEAHGIAELINKDKLAKLMLLERFHEVIYEHIFGNIATSENGKSEELAALEASAKGGAAKKAAPKGEDVEPRFPIEWQENEALLEWALIEPSLADVDLRPYYYVSREKSPKLATAIGLGAELDQLSDTLASGNLLLIAGTREQLRKLDEKDARKVFDSLAERAKQNPTWKVKPKEIEGMYELCEQQVSLQENLVMLLESIPVTDLDVWAASGLQSVINGEAAKKRLSALQESWLAQTENPDLKKAVEKLKTL